MFCGTDFSLSESEAVTAPATGEDARHGEALAQSHCDKGAVGVGECGAGGDVKMTSL